MSLKPALVYERKKGLAMQLTLHDVLVDDLDVIIAVRPSVLMPEPHHMAQFVNHNAKFVTVFADGDVLWPVASFAHK